MAGVGRISITELQQLQQLTALSTICIHSPSWDPATVAVLAGMTGGCMAVNCYKHGGAALQQPGML
jgi:hypothetical protein